MGRAGNGSCQLETFPIYLLLMGMEKEGSIFIGEVGKGVGDSPCLWSVPRKQDNAPCPGLKDPGVPRVDNEEGNGGEGMKE